LAKTVTPVQNIKRRDFLADFLGPIQGQRGIGFLHDDCEFLSAVAAGWSWS